MLHFEMYFMLGTMLKTVSTDFVYTVKVFGIQKQNWNFYILLCGQKRRHSVKYIILCFTAKEIHTGLNDMRMSK